MRGWTAQEIKAFRQRHGLTQAELGALVGVTPQYVCYLETGVRKASKPLSALLECLEKHEMQRRLKREKGKK